MASRKKLTLSVDEQIIERAHRYSQRHNTSLSQLVSNYLARLADSEAQQRYSPTVRRLIGILPRNLSVEEYHRHIEEKYSR
ncbi:MAG: DUF6364 family protein [Candidatus Latescibacterota bacterium]